MSKQNNFRLSKTKNNILYALSGAMLMLFAGLMLFPAISEYTHAEGDESDDGITIIFSPNISIDLESKEDGYFKIVKDTAEISTSSQNGYTLYLSTDTPEHQDIYLNGDVLSTSKISGTSGTYESPAPLEDYTWGWAVPGISHFNDSYDTENPDTEAKFAAVPLQNQIIRDYITPATGDVAEIYYGFKLGGELESGSYETNITYTAVPDVEPLTTKAILGENGNLNFVYDRKTYAAGDAYTDNLGDTIINKIYEIPMEGMNCLSSTVSMPWISEKNTITSVNIDVSFVNARPAQTCYWFYDLRNVTAMTNMQNLNTSNVVSMHSMFESTGRNAASLAINGIDGWDTSRVEDMCSMFASSGYNADAWNIGDLGDWDTSSLVATTYMFGSAGRNASTWDVGDLDDWDLSNVIYASGMFDSAGGSATTWNVGNLSKWNTSSIINMSRMFAGAGGMDDMWSLGDISHWSTGSVTNMSSMFVAAGTNASKWDVGDFGHWDTSKVNSMYQMFAGSGLNSNELEINLDLSAWDTSSVTDMSGMFMAMGQNAALFMLGDLSEWKTGGVTDMSSMFAFAGNKARVWNIGNLDEWDTGNVTTMNGMFREAGVNADSWNIGNIGGWNTGLVVNMSKMFEYTGYKSTTWNIGDISGWVTGRGVNHTDFINLNLTGSNASVVNNQPNWPN